MPDSFNICLDNCNNIDSCSIVVKKSCLNVKYGINGTGKTTIANAIKYGVEDQNENSNQLETLKPYKHTNNENRNPKILGINNVHNVGIFNEDYINEFIFKPDELLQGSFDIFIRTDEYEKGIKEIDIQLKEIKDSFVKDPELEMLINDFRELIECFGNKTEKGIHKSSKIMKALGDGNKIKNIPAEVECYKDFIAMDNNIKWIKWQQDGKDYLDLTDNCPYCVSEIKTKKEQIRKISEIYKPKDIEHLNFVMSQFEKLNKYFSNEAKTIIANLIKKPDKYSEDETNYLRRIRQQAEELNEHFMKAFFLSFNSLKDVDKIAKELGDLKIDLSYYSDLNSNETQNKIKILNDGIEKTLKKIGILQGKINIQKNRIKEIIDENKKEINTFLINAGYKYKVDLKETDDGEYRLKLVPFESNDELVDVRDHLSFGERNAFALVLFMYDMLKNSPDLIILDDPISSFDKNKKYAILDMLFRREKCLKNKTILLLTHDFEPIIDLKYNHGDVFGNSCAYFLENINGRLTEKKIERSDIKSFSDICESNIDDSSVSIISKIVYLRRLYETRNLKDVCYQLVSNLIHKRDFPKFITDTEERDMTSEEIAYAKSEIIKIMPDFNYESIISIIKNDEEMKKIYLGTHCNYEKIHIYRILFSDKDNDLTNTIISKYINEEFHIENEYIFQLNPIQFQMVPQYIIDECDKFINNI